MRATGIGVKICGLCSPVAAREAVLAGADYAGVIVGAESPRRRSIEAASEIWAAATGALRVGVFADAPVETVARVAETARLDVVQLHGSEDGGQVRALRGAGAWSIWKAIRPRSAEEFERLAGEYAGLVDGILVDGWSARSAGGTGARFDWDAIASLRS
ncbi:MAG: phosphoribosylanthranilate isomerase, partial [Gemmatimonadetes bacterium]|nr:phosphoribosylanthranilate isomerase [Gemmatimonadota bacterium]